MTRPLHINRFVLLDGRCKIRDGKTRHCRRPGRAAASGAARRVPGRVRRFRVITAQALISFRRNRYSVLLEVSGRWSTLSPARHRARCDGRGPPPRFGGRRTIDPRRRSCGRARTGRACRVHHAAALLPQDMLSAIGGAGRGCAASPQPAQSPRRILSVHLRRHRGQAERETHDEEKERNRWWPTTRATRRSVVEHSTTAACCCIAGTGMLRAIAAVVAEHATVTGAEQHAAQHVVQTVSGRLSRRRVWRHVWLPSSDELVEHPFRGWFGWRLSAAPTSSGR